MKQVKIFDSTLRDGSQAEGISFSVEDKIKIVNALDKLGVSYIEAGNPASNPKDLEFFNRIKDMPLENAILTAFGSTRRPNVKADSDSGLQSLLAAETNCVAIFGKCWDFHVTDIIHTTLDENLAMIKETVEFLKNNGKEVVFDGEHFYDGYKRNAEYAMKCLNAAVEGGCDCLSLCDTNGGTFPDEIYDITKNVVETFPNVVVGVHCHNDCGLAVANSLMGVKAGATHVQGTYIGYGERCGNANLSTIIPNLQAKWDYYCIPEENIKMITSTARFIAEVSNITLYEREAYVGKSAFAHKGGMHIDGVSKAPESFEHMSPETVGNERKFLMSEVAGRSTIINKIKKVCPDITKDSPETKAIMEKLKKMEHEGYQFEVAESTFELLIRKELGKYTPQFELIHFKTIGEQPIRSDFPCSALIKIKVDGKTEITAAEGDGPVNALDKALRQALYVFYPQLKEVHLTDYKVRVLDSKTATASKVRVLIESTDGEHSWSTVGVSTDIIEASWLALVDSIEYKLIKDMENKAR